MRIVGICLKIAFCCVILASTGCSSSVLKNKERSAPETEGSFRWPQGKRGAISLTFDDARLSQIDRGGVKATFYVSLKSLEKRLNDWKQAAADGHDIGNHTLTHPCSGNFHFARERALENYTLDKMRAELRQASDSIENLLGVTPVSFAYPCGQKFVGRGRTLKSYVPLVAAEFQTGRGWMDEWANDPAFCDMAQLMAMELDGKDFEQVKQTIERTLANGGWLIFCGHDIGEGGRQTTRSSTLRALCEYAQDPANGLWLDSVETVARHILRQRALAGAVDYRDPGPSQCAFWWPSSHATTQSSNYAWP
ncbi:MAG: polysaccharide deacetylase family protein [Planctomycetota bacterium]|jgi:peptidoglycan/xylan/chitin deacetylase (PgdA/CDA1 family)